MGIPVPLVAVLGAARGSLQGATSSAQDGAVDSVRTCALLALTALVTNDQLRLAPTDGAPLMLAIAIAAGHHLELRCAPSRASELPSPAAFNSAYFLLVVLLRQQSRLVHRAVPLLIATIRGLLLTAAWRFAPHRRVEVCSSPPRGDGVGCGHRRDAGGRLLP